MKKIYSLMVAAVALFAAASCNKEISQEQLPVGETVVYTASVDGADTKAVLDGTVSKWCGEELITLHDGQNAFTFYANAGETPVLEVDFTYTPGEGQPTFTATEVMAIYPSGDYTANVSDKTVSNIVIPNNQTLADNTYPATSAVAVAHSTTTDLSFKNATTLLKFKVAGDDVTFGCIAAEGDISGTFDLAYNDGEPILTATTANQWVDFSKNDEFLSKDATYYIAVAPAALNKITMYLNGTEVKSKTFEQPYKLKRNVILDLGTVTYTAPETASTVYLKPGVWSVDGAWYVAYFFNSTGNVAVKMEKDADGLFEAAVPEGDYSKVIFCRMNPDYAEFGWDVWEGETMVEDRVWDQTANLSVPVKADDKLCYVVKDWNVYEWQTLEDAKYVAPEFVAQEGYIYLQPSSEWLADNARFAAYFFNGTWADMTLVEGQKDIYQCAIPEEEINVIFCRMNPSAIENSWDYKWNQTGNLKMTDGSLYIVSGWDEGSWTGDPAVTEPEPEPDQPEVVVGYWAVTGTMNDWGDYAKLTLDGDWHVATEVKLTKADQFKLRADGDWGVNRGAAEGEDGVVIENNVETAVVQGGKNFSVAENGMYSVYINKSATIVKVVRTGDIPLPSVKNWGIVGNITQWGENNNPDIPMVLNGDWYIASGVEMPAGTQFKFRVDGKWASDGGEELTYGGTVMSGTEYSVGAGSSNIMVTSGAIYDVYLSHDETKMKVVKVGDLPNPAIMAKDGYVYLLPNSNWNQAGARFAIYFYGNGETWVSMTKVEGTSYYGAKISDIISKGYTHLIFCRMNPANAGNNWDNKWNQTGNLNVSDFKSGKNCFTVPSNSWDGATASWSTVDKLN